ncbi:unnamed protein product, partial [Discosporangium mesarthrocarpum]
MAYQSGAEVPFEGGDDVINLSPMWIPASGLGDHHKNIPGREGNRVPVPLWKARNILVKALADDGLLQRSWGCGEREGGCRVGQPSTVHLKRLEVMVDPEELGGGQAAPLAWFMAQPPPRSAPLSDPTLPRVFLRTPFERVTCAGLGAAHIITGEGGLDKEAWEAASARRAIRYFGGARFDPVPDHGQSGKVLERSSLWESFGGHWLVLPLVELSSEAGT